MCFDTKALGPITSCSLSCMLVRSQVYRRRVYRPAASLSAAAEAKIHENMYLAQHFQGSHEPSDIASSIRLYLLSLSALFLG